MRTRCACAILTCCVLSAPTAIAQHGERPASAETTNGKPINAVCPIGKEPIVASAGTIEYKGRVLGFCCPGCASPFLAWDDARKDEFIRMSLASHATPDGEADEQVSAGASEGPSYPYTLDTCPISGKKLGSMGDPVVREYDGREVRFCCAGCIEAFEADKAKHWAAIDKKIVEQQLMHYPLDTCIVTGDELGESAVNHVHNNRLVRLADEDAVNAFKSEPARHLEALDKKIVELQLPAYPMDQCPVGGALGSMGEPVNFIYMNRLVRFCCDGCESSLVEEPGKHMAKLDKAYADAQRTDYPLDTCPVSGAPLGSMGEPVELVAGTTLVRFCCDGCIPAFRKEPRQRMAEIRN